MGITGSDTLAHNVILEPQRPRRRPWRRLLVPLLVLLLLVVAVVVAGAGRRTRDQIEYLEAMRANLSEISMSGLKLQDVIGRLPRIDRSEFTATLDDIEAVLAVATAHSAGAPPTPDLVSAAALYRLAVGSWASGISGFREGVLEAADNPESAGATDVLIAALVELRAGDALYLDLISELETEGIPQPVSSLPEVALLPMEAPLEVLAGAYVDAARADSNSLALRPGLAVAQVLAEPEWVRNAADAIVVPATESIVFTIVVQNNGNLASSDARVRVTLVGEEETTEEVLVVPPLSPGVQTSLMTTAMAVTEGGFYRIQAELVPTQPDNDPDDNVLAVEFVVNEG